MAVLTQWMDGHKTVIYLHYESTWSWQDAVDAHEEANRLMKTVKHNVALIFDLSDSQFLPPMSLSKIREMSFMRGTRANDSGITIFVNADILTQAIVEFLERTEVEDLPQLSAFYTHTLDDAIEIATTELEKYNKGAGDQ